MTKLRIAVLLSGSGSNLQAIIDRCADGSINAEIGIVLSNKEDAYGLTRARKAGIDTAVVRHKDFPDRESFEAKMIECIDRYDTGLVCLAGFMRVLTPRFVGHYHGRLINIHPALLPAFPGLHVQKAALDYGAKFSGATVHYVDEGVDSGAIIAQAVVPILDGDTPETLSARILIVEHRIYPMAIKLIADDDIELIGRRVIVKSKNYQTPEETSIIQPHTLTGAMK